MFTANFKQTMTKVWHDCQHVTVRFERDENISTTPSRGTETM